MKKKVFEEEINKYKLCVARLEGEIAAKKSMPEETIEFGIRIPGCGREIVSVKEAVRLIVDHLNLKFEQTPPSSVVLVSKEKGK